MDAPYDRYVGRGTDPRTGEPGERENPYSRRPSRVVGVIVVPTLAVRRHELWLADQLRRGLIPLGRMAAARLR